jgi:thioredoxin-dependent peroxiredoxin
VLKFFPAAGTYGCTCKACSFHDTLSNSKVYRDTGCEVIGNGSDPVTKQRKFVDKHGLGYCSSVFNTTNEETTHRS